MASKYYAVKIGRKTGLFTSWDQCKESIDGYKGAVYKSFGNIEQAKAYLKGNYDQLPVEKYYAVRHGREIGIFTNWEKCKEAIDGYPTPSYKSFKTRAEAEAFLRGEEYIEPMPEGVDYQVYVDGSYKDGRYSYGFVFVKDGKPEFRGSGVGTDKEAASMRNVAGEILAAMEAVKLAKQLRVKICIYHDYVGIAAWVEGYWQAKNIYTQEYVRMMREHREFFKFQHVKGHSGNKFNDFVDKLAKKELGIV